MSDFPWFPFWVSDFLASRKVRVMSAEEVGSYLLLLCTQWQEGAVRGEMDELVALCQGADPNSVQAVLDRCFEERDGEWVNSRLEAVREEQEERREAKVRAGKASAKSRRRKKIEQRSSTVETPLEQKGNQSKSKSDTKETTAAARVREFCARTDSEWRLDKSIPEWVEQIREEGKYRRIDIEYEIGKCADWHVGKKKTPKAPDMSIRNWLERSVRHLEESGNGDGRRRKSRYVQSPTQRLPRHPADDAE